MGFIPRITCRRCGRQFSGVRSRCPYCGTRRVSQSERSPSPTPGTVEGTPAAARSNINTKWQMTFGIILLAAIILAVIVLVSSNLNSSAKSTPTPDLPLFSFTPIPPPPTNSPTPVPKLEKISITFYARVVEDFALDIDGTLQLKAVATPADVAIEGYVKWTSKDPTIATVDDTGLVTGVSPGSVILTVECFGVTSETICRVRQQA